MARLFTEAGFAEGVFQHLIIDHDQTAAAIADDRIRAVTLTGSEGAGRSIGKQAGEALKPCVLELGGTDAFVVLADADLDAAVETGVQARTQNNGQSCIAAKRFILERPIAEAPSGTEPIPQLARLWPPIEGVVLRPAAVFFIAIVMAPMP